MKSWFLGLVGAALGICAVAYAQVPGVIPITSLVGKFSIGIATMGPQSAVLPVNGGTFVCSTTVAVPNTAVDGGSIILTTLKTAGGTVSSHFVASVTPGVGFTESCGSSDTSTYNYVIFG